MKEKILFIIVIIYFLLSAVFHFVRLALGWDVFFANYEIPSFISATCFLFSVIVAYFLYKVYKEKNTKVDIRSEKEKNNEL